jgi:serine/threonine protein kinase
MKSLKKSQIESNEDVYRHLLTERSILHDLKHPLIAKFFHELEDDNHAYFLMSFVPGGELRSLLRIIENNNQSRKISLPLNICKFYLLELCDALLYIHYKDIVHRDLRPENICIDELGHIKVIDFGHSAYINTHLSGKLYTICCPPSYLSPECLNENFTGGYGK